MAWKEYKMLCTVDSHVEGMTCDAPYVPVHMTIGGDVFDSQGMIDSGCNTTMASHEVAEFLEIDLYKLPTVYVGAAGGFFLKGKQAKIKMKVDDLGDYFETPVVFVDNLKPQVLLGQQVLFEKFDVLFERHKSTFSIRIAGEE